MTRKRVPVNEQLLQEMIAGENVDFSSKTGPENEVKEQQVSEINEERKKQKRSELSGKGKKPNYEELYLVCNPVSKYSRQQVYVNGDLYERYARFLKVVADQKMSMTSFINNILLRHWEDNKEVMNELYENSLHKPL